MIDTSSAKDYTHSTMDIPRIEECLRRSDKQGLYSIGADIVINPPTREYVLGGIHVLRENLIKLRASDAPHDIQAIKDINKYFKKSDYSHASANLNENLDVPLGYNIVEWLSEGTDHDIEQFCLWSLRRTRQLTEAINRDHPRLADHTHYKTNKLERIGLFPSTASALMQKATDEYTLAGMDSFFSGGRRVIGFCVDDEIVFSNQYRLHRPMRIMSTTMKRYMFHEYLHGAAKDRVP